MYALAILGLKGGVGKTTLAVSLAAWMAGQAHRTLLIDLTYPGGDVGRMLGEEIYPGAAQLLEGDIKGAIRASRIENLDLILSGSNNAIQASNRLTSTSLGVLVLAEQMAQVGLRYDVVILDTGPTVDVTHVSALAAADGFLIPVTLEPFALQGAKNVIKTRDGIPDILSTARFLGVVPNRWDRVTKASKAQLQVLIETFPQELIWPPIPEDVRLRESTSRGKTIWEYAPRSRAVLGIKTEADDGTVQRVGGLMKIAHKVEHIANLQHKPSAAEE